MAPRQTAAQKAAAEKAAADAQTTTPTAEQPAEPTPTPAAPTRPRNVVEAIVAVMRDVDHVAKSERNTQGTGYNFRGIDGTVNALGPAMRRHGLIMLPGRVLEYKRGDVLVGRQNTKMGHVNVTMEYTFLYSNEDGETSTLPVQVPGESMDSGDKATPKAMSVALRTALLQGFMLPTMQPDPDESTYERSQVDGAHEPAAAPYVPTDAEIVGWVAEAFVNGGRDRTDSYLRNVLTNAEGAGMDGRTITVPDRAAGDGATKQVTVRDYITQGMAALNARLLESTPREGTVEDAQQDAQDAPAPAEHAARERADQQVQDARPGPAQDAPPAQGAQQYSPQEAAVRDALMSELDGQADLIGESPATLLNGLLPDTLDTASLRSAVFVRRPQAIALLREAGRHEAADRYEEWAQGQRIAPWDVLTDAPETAAATQG